ncbi:MAG: putative metal-binding motif-containing protein [Polyangiaceae bacterium]
MRSSLLALMVVLGTAGCSSDEFDKAGGTGGKTGDAGGAGGASGASGASGSSGSGGVSGSSGTGGGSGGLPADCINDKDCDDKLACTGVEKCTGGKCVAGTAVTCTNPDTANCEAVCEEPSGTCVVRGKDVDGDQHFDVACTVATTAGDDCDDSNAAVYTGAPEVCDGVDNDCNGKDEFADNKAVIKGAVGDFVSSGMLPDVAWAPSAKKYGAVWHDSNVKFTTVDATGTKGAIVTLTGGVEAQPPRIAWNGSAFGVAWKNGTAVHFAAYKPDGTELKAPHQVSDSNAKAGVPDVVGTATGWTVLWSDTRTNANGTLHTHLIDASGTEQGGDVPVGVTAGVNKEPAMAESGTNALVAVARVANIINTTTPNTITVFDPKGANGLGLAQELVSLPAGSSVVHPAVAATPVGWAVAWAAHTPAADSIGYAEELTNRQLVCSPITTTVTATQPAFVGGVAARGAARIVVFGQGTTAASAQLVRFNAGCSGPQQIKLDDADVPDWVSFGFPTVAWGDQSAMVLFPDQANGIAKVRYWISGPNLCDNPVP